MASDVAAESSADRPSYNAAADLIGRNLRAGRASKTAFIDESGPHSYGEVAERVTRCAGGLRGLGLEAGARVVLCLLDTIDFPTAFLGAIHAGIVPIPLNTLLPPQDYAFVLADSGAKAAVVSAALLPQFREAARIADWPGRIIVSGAAGADVGLASLMASGGTATDEPHPAWPDDPCFWLYSSGSTGTPKGTVHRQASLVRTAELFAQGVLGLHTDDLVYSAAKLFFAYGLGNALTFPMAVGATSVLLAERPTPAAVGAILRQHPVTLFCGVPTLYATLLAHPDLPRRDELRLRLCTSAGEALPAEIGRNWTAHTGTEIIDGIGSTEMLHIFVSNRPGAVRYGTTGLPVPGYAVRLRDEQGAIAEPGAVGELEVQGPTAATLYWNNPDKTRATFIDGWVRTGDKFRQDETGAFIYCGRTDDMLKVGGIWVSPAEIEATLLCHEAVLEAAVIGKADAGGLIKPKAFVVLKGGGQAGPDPARALQDFVKSRLAPYKYPRWIAFVDDLPKTATGKIRRHVLRAQEQNEASDLTATG